MPDNKKTKDQKNFEHNLEDIFMEPLWKDADIAKQEIKMTGQADDKILSSDQKSQTKTSKKIPGVTQEDGSDCCGGGCCEIDEKEVLDKSVWIPELSTKEYLEIINNVVDPELGVGIVDIGLIYDVVEHADGQIDVKMTLTSMGCPAGAQITSEIDAMLRMQPHVTDVQINLVWEPAWNPSLMNEEVKLMLFGDSEPQIPKY